MGFFLAVFYAFKREHMHLSSDAFYGYVIEALQSQKQGVAYKSSIYLQKRAFSGFNRCLSLEKQLLRTLCLKLC
jgi:hypothetical protein